MESTESNDIRPTSIDIDLSAFGHNLVAIRNLAPASKVMPVVKANAYGHGLGEVALELERCGADALAVAFVEEGVELRKVGVKVPVLVMGGISTSQLSLFLNHDLDITASSIAKLEAIEKSAEALKRRARVHLKIDTGMERVGVHYYSAQSILERALQMKHCDIIGVYSHVSAASPGDTSQAKVQLERFLEVASFFDRASLPVVKHFASSASLLTLPAGALDMVRPGLLTYGVMPWSGDAAARDFKPALQLKSAVVYFKVVKKGAGVSYGHTWHADRDTRVVTVPIGYGDGYQRRLSNKGEVLIRSKRYPIVGTICMDQMMVNIGEGEAFNSDEVVLLGQQGRESIRVEDLAELVETTPHEILVALNMRLPRTYRRSNPK